MYPHDIQLDQQRLFRREELATGQEASNQQTIDLGPIGVLPVWLVVILSILIGGLLLGTFYLVWRRSAGSRDRTVLDGNKKEPEFVEGTMLGDLQARKSTEVGNVPAKPTFDGLLKRHESQKKGAKDLKAKNSARKKTLVDLEENTDDSLVDFELEEREEKPTRKPSLARQKSQSAGSQLKHKKSYSNRSRSRHRNEEPEVDHSNSVNSPEGLAEEKRAFLAGASLGTGGVAFSPTVNHHPINNNNNNSSSTLAVGKKHDLVASYSSDDEVEETRLSRSRSQRRSVRRPNSASKRESESAKPLIEFKPDDKTSGLTTRASISRKKSQRHHSSGHSRPGSANSRSSRNSIDNGSGGVSRSKSTRRKDAPLSRQLSRRQTKRTTFEDEDKVEISRSKSTRQRQHGSRPDSASSRSKGSITPSPTTSPNSSPVPSPTVLAPPTRASSKIDPDDDEKPLANVVLDIVQSNLQQRKN